MAKSLSELKVRTYDVYIFDGASAVDLGYSDEPLVTIKKITKPIKVSELHDQELGTRLLGVEATVTVNLRQVPIATFARAFPWFSGTPGTDSIPVMPSSLGQDLYDYAQKWVLHPRDKGLQAYGVGEYDASEDFTLLKGAIISDVARAGKGTDEDPLKLTVKFYPDRASLPNLLLGYIGPIPA